MFSNLPCVTLVKFVPSYVKFLWLLYMDSVFPWDLLNWWLLFIES